MNCQYVIYSGRNKGLVLSSDLFVGHLKFTQFDFCAMQHFLFRVMIPQVRIIASGLRPAAASLLRFSARTMTSAPATTSSSSIGQTEDNSNPTFASLMRNCKLTSMGNPVGQVVVGKVYHIVDDDLYIDFGHKFGCICKKPRYTIITFDEKKSTKCVIKLQR